ncbi:unnamed protein product [Brassica oleracea var. botrytis]|uniref:Uncharacterized protein n=2 Tax=Brassica TaxID=3705 RepID=A0ABQ7CXL3_BRACR|nr:hypothetical protein DY000_02015234 [Brassica cretica]CAF1745371.1 unnamed protein product [Brassica napus]
MVVTIVRIESIDGSLSVYDSPVPSSSVSFTLVSEVRVIDLGREDSAWKKVKREEKKRGWAEKRGKWYWTEEETRMD